MPNKQSAKKELNKSEKRREANKKVLLAVKQLIKKSRKAIEANASDAKELVAQTMKALDKAAQKKIIKGNTKNRKKSRLHLKLNSIVKK